MTRPAPGAPTLVPLVLGVFAVALLPWTFVYISALPSRHVTRHWDLIWVGFDLAIAVMLAATALAAAFHRVWLPALAGATAALLAADAWFDVGTAGPGQPLVLASLEAGLAELPLAALCIWVALDASWATRGRRRAAA
jgi:hypothetical protein